MTRLTLPAAGRAPFSDPAARVKILIGGAIGLVPVLGGLWPTGYAVAYVRRLIRDPADVTLPEWENWRAYVRDGLAVWTIVAVWQAPGLLALSIAAAYLTVAAIEWTGLAYLGAPEGYGTAALLWTAGGVILLLAGSLLLPASILAYVLTGRLGPAFRPRDLARLIANDRAGYLAVWGRGFVTLVMLLVVSLFPPALILIIIAGTWIGFYLTLVWSILWSAWAAENGLAERV